MPVDKEKIASLKLRINSSSKAVKNFAVNRIREVLDSEARRADSYSKKKYTFEEAYRDARSKGQRTFYWDGKYYNTDYEGVHGKRYREDVDSGKAAAFQEKYPGFTNPELRKEKQEELDTYGITNEQTQNKNIVSQRLLDNIDPFGDYDLTQAIDAVVLNHKQRKGDALTQAKNETHIAQLRNYLGYPAELIKFTTPDGAPVKISKYTPTTGDSQEGKYYYTFKRNPFGYQPQNQERYLSEYKRLKSIGDKYLDEQFYDDAHKYGLDYATKIADENMQAWSDYYDNHRDEIQGYEPLESAFIITPETGSKEQRRSYGNAGGLGNFTVYNNPAYSSFYDLWDIGLGQGENTKTFGVGKPFEYYDRRYHNPAEEPDIDKLYDNFGKSNEYRRGGRKKTFLKDPTGYTGGGVSGGRAGDPRMAYAKSNNKWERIGNNRYWLANDSLVRSGSTPEDADRLARILAAQSALETGWVDDVKGNNFAGYMSNGKRMSFNSPDEFWDYHIKNLDKKWPGWRQADSIESYYNIVNSANLGLDTLDKFNAYNKKHRDNPAYIYAPAWENENYLGKLSNVYNKYISKYVPNSFAGGGDIHIKESKKGTFTAAAKAHGKSVQAFASQVLANKGNYSPAMVKKANFARNAAKWHSDGGAINQAIDDGKVDIILAAINNIRNKKI